MTLESAPTFRNELAGLPPSPQSAPPAPWLLSSLRELRLPAVLALIALAALCLAFLDVVNGAVAQGQARRQAQTTQAEAQWRCQAQRDTLLRSDCQLRLGLVAGNGQPLPNGITLATVALRDLP